MAVFQYSLNEQRLQGSAVFPCAPHPLGLPALSAAPGCRISCKASQKHRLQQHHRRRNCGIHESSFFFSLRRFKQIITQGIPNSKCALDSNYSQGEPGVLCSVDPDCDHTGPPRTGSPSRAARTAINGKSGIAVQKCIFVLWAQGKLLFPKQQHCWFPLG